MQENEEEEESPSYYRDLFFSPNFTHIMHVYTMCNKAAKKELRRLLDSDSPDC